MAVASAGLHAKSASHPRQPHQHPTTQFFTGRMPFLPPNQQRQSIKCMHQKDKTILYFNEARNDGMEVASSGAYANMQLAPDHARTSLLNFYRPDTPPDYLIPNQHHSVKTLKANIKLTC